MKVSFVGSRRPLVLYRLLLEDLDTPHSLALAICLKHSDYSEMFRIAEVSPSSYNSARALALDRQAGDFLKKSPSFVSENMETRTSELFAKCELSCEDTNKFWRNSPTLSETHNRAFFIMRDKISHILGGIPRSLNYSFGPGVSMTVRGDDTAAYSKFSVAPVDVTENARPFAEKYLSNSLWGSFLERSGPEKTKVVNFSRTAQVPKSYKINRLIAVEPTFNTYVQKGIGSYIRDRLKLAGVDLRRQDHNQYFASVAHTEGLATVDFSSASDTIAYGTVLELLPIDWFQVLDSFRTPNTELDGKVIPLQKFSSMGNGYTFELESLIFYAAAFAAVKLGSNRLDCISVYGDDVIIPQEDFLTFQSLCQLLGFSINTEKTFTSGAFFESCGKDFFNGTDVRPNYLKNDLTSDFDIFTCRNRLLAFFNNWGISDAKALTFLESKVPGNRLCVVPFPYSGGFWPSERIKGRYTTDKNGWEGIWTRALSFRSSTRRNTVFEPALLHSFSSADGGLRPLRRSGNYRKTLTFFPVSVLV